LLKVNFLFSSDSVEIYQLYKQLKDGVPFDSYGSFEPSV